MGSLGDILPGWVKRGTPQSPAGSRQCKLCMTRADTGWEPPAQGLLDVTLQVEVWLNRVLASMRSTLRRLIPEAVVTYEEKPREQWVFDYPAQVGAAVPEQEQAESPGRSLSPRGDGAFPFTTTFCPCGLLQVALTCTQIWWTTEVGIAFSRLEEGYENAMRDYNKKQVGIPRT